MRIYLDLRRARLRIPAHELGEVAAANVGKTLHELLNRRRLAIVTGEVEIHSRAKEIRSEQRPEHTHDLGTLLVNRGGVEVIDLVIKRGPYRMRERSRILDELRCTQLTHVADALHGA